MAAGSGSIWAYQAPMLSSWPYIGPPIEVALSDIFGKYANVLVYSPCGHGVMPTHKCRVLGPKELGSYLYPCVTCGLAVEDVVNNHPFKAFMEEVMDSLSIDSDAASERMASIFGKYSEIEACSLCGHGIATLDKDRVLGIKKENSLYPNPCPECRGPVATVFKSYVLISCMRVAKDALAIYKKMQISPKGSLKIKVELPFRLVPLFPGKLSSFVLAKHEEDEFGHHLHFIADNPESLIKAARFRRLTFGDLERILVLHLDVGSHPGETVESVEYRRELVLNYLAFFEINICKVAFSASILCAKEIAAAQAIRVLERTHGFPKDTSAIIKDWFEKIGLRS